MSTTLSPTKTTPTILVRGQESVGTDLRGQGAPATSTEDSKNLDY